MSDPSHAQTAWPDQPTHRAWLDDHCRSLLAFGERCPAPGGGAFWLDDAGRPDPGRGIHTWITARMVHVYSLGRAARRAGQRTTRRRRPGGTRPARSVTPTTAAGSRRSTRQATAASGKACYDHAFVVLAASSATAAGRPGAVDLLQEALGVFDARFWDAEAGMPVDLWDTRFEQLDGYRGINAAMHSTEAMLAAADVLTEVLGDTATATTCRRRALGMLARVAGWAGESGWRVPEHFDDAWQPQPEHNADRPDDQFKPYGATVGHGLEWARLMLHGEAAAAAAGDEAPEGLLAAAESLFERAVADGWDVDGHPGFVYTTDWSGVPGRAGPDALGGRRGHGDRRRAAPAHG